MKMIGFDFHTISDVDEFYQQFMTKFAIETDFGANLDALWDALTGMIDLPVRVTLRHLAEHENAAQFDAIVAVMQEAEKELAGQFSLRLK